MPGYLTAAAKATSTFCLLWSAYLLTRSRTRKKPLASTTHPDEASVTIPKNSDALNAYPLDFEEAVTSLSSHSSLTDLPRSDDSESGMRSLLHQSWSAVTGFLSGRFSDSTPSQQLLPLNSTLSTEKLMFYLDYATALAEKANLSPDVLAYSKKALLLGSNQSPEVLAKALLEGLVAYTKSDEFVEILLHDAQFPHLLHFLVQLASASYHPSPQPREPRLVSLLDHPSVAPNEWPSATTGTISPFHRTSKSQQERTPLSDVLQTKQSHPEYPIHLLVANILANVSRNVKQNHVLSNIEVETLLATWCSSPSLHLLLLSAKIRFNLQASQINASRARMNGPEYDVFEPVYYPDIFRLDKPNQSNSDHFNDQYDVDIIFVHGMRGSVFYTWRQNDTLIEIKDAGETTPSKCWPRDWLSSDFPRARVLGIDTSLSPFIWNPICPIDRLKRTLDTRAKALLPQLEAAGVGRRPIIWITHSAGGILVKELIRLSKRGEMNSSEGDSSNISTQSDLNARCSSSAIHRFDNLVVKPSSASHPQNAIQPQWFCDPSEVDNPTDPHSLHPCTYDFTDVPHLSTSALTSSPNLHRRRFNTVSEGLGCENSVASHPFSNPQNTLADNTRGVIFMSAPHRGNQSLFALYRWPLRWTLTPEAIQLERNSAYLLDLHSWFNLWALRAHVRVLTMVEQRVTPVNRFWSVLLVPEDKRDREMGEVVHIDSDHMYISKPRCRTDPTYMNIINFIRQTLPDEDTTPALTNRGSSHSSDGNSTIAAN